MNRHLSGIDRNQDVRCNRTSHPRRREHRDHVGLLLLLLRVSIAATTAATGDAEEDDGPNDEKIMDKVD